MIPHGRLMVQGKKIIKFFVHNQSKLKGRRERE